MLHTSKNEKCLFDYHNLMRCIHIQFEADEKKQKTLEYKINGNNGDERENDGMVEKRA